MQLWFLLGREIKIIQSFPKFSSLNIHYFCDLKKVILKSKLKWVYLFQTGNTPGNLGTYRSIVGPWGKGISTWVVPAERKCGEKALYSEWCSHSWVPIRAWARPSEAESPLLASERPLGTEARKRNSSGRPMGLWVFSPVHLGANDTGLAECWWGASEIIWVSPPAMEHGAGHCTVVFLNHIPHSQDLAQSSGTRKWL